MKKIYIVAALLLSCFSAYSQITLTYSANAPVAGDTLSYIQLADTSLKEGMFGSNQVWNLHNIRPIGTVVHQYYKKASATPYYKSFPDAQLALFDSVQAMYTYFYTDSNSMYKLGTATALDTTRYADSEKVWQFPLAYNTYIIDTFQWTKPKELRTGQIVITADGYGKAILPSVTDSNVLRVQTMETTKSINFTNPGPDTSIEIITTYSYYIPGKKWPAIQIVYDQKSGGTFKSVRYFPETTPTGIANHQNSITHTAIYPNPANQNITLSMETKTPGTLHLEVLNTLGQSINTVYNGNISSGAHSYILQKNTLAPGIYFISVRFNDSFEIQKLIVE